MATFPDQLAGRAASAIAQTRRLVQNAHQRLNTIGSQVASLTPGDWQALALQNGWSNVAGYIPAQVRILQNGVAQIVGHIQGGTTVNGTLIAALGAGYYNTVHAHQFTANVTAGASAVTVQAAGSTDQDGLPNGGIQGTSASASGSGSHSHGAGGYSVTNGQHTHAAAGGVGTIATDINYNTVTLNLDTSGNLTLSNCSSSATQVSFNETLPLVTS